MLQYATITMRLEVVEMAIVAREVNRSLNQKHNYDLPIEQHCPEKLQLKKRQLSNQQQFVFFDKKSNEAPKISSATPDKSTTISFCMGTQLGTCAKNAVRIKVRCPVPVKMNKMPSNTLVVVLAFVECVILFHIILD